jgi:hypothetical protein
MGAQKANSCGKRRDRMSPNEVCVNLWGGMSGTEALSALHSSRDLRSILVQSVIGAAIPAAKPGEAARTTGSAPVHSWSETALDLEFRGRRRAVPAVVVNAAQMGF